MDISLDDFRKMYEGCYVLIDDKEIALFDTVDRTLGFITANAGEIQLPATQATFKRVSHLFPERGLYNIEDRAYIFGRIPARQWKRGICSKNAEIRSLLRFMDGDWVPSPDISLRTVEQLFNPKYYSLKEALTYPNLYSRALSLSFAISVTDNLKYSALLWFNTRAIGHIKAESREIILHNQDFFEEVRDFIKAKEPEWTLTVLPR